MEGGGRSRAVEDEGCRQGQRVQAGAEGVRQGQRVLPLTSCMRMRHCTRSSTERMPSSVTWLGLGLGSGLASGLGLGSGLESEVRVRVSALEHDLPQAKDHHSAGLAVGPGAVAVMDRVVRKVEPCGSDVRG